MVKVKSLEDIKKHYREGATVAPSRFKDAVATSDWKTPAASADAEALYAAKMAEVVSEQRRRKGIDKTGNEEWRSEAINKGAVRIGPGMTGAVDKQASNYSPFKAALEGVSLPGRTADPMTNIDTRVKPIVSVLVAKKKEILG